MNKIKFSASLLSRQAGLGMALVASIALLGCNSMGSKDSNMGPRIGERYQAPKVQASAPQQLDLPEISKINLKLASAYYSEGQYQTANEVIAVSLATTPNDVTVLGLAALIQAELRNRPKAQELFDRAFKVAPKDADLNHNYGVYLCRNNDPARALEHFKIALAVEGYQRPGSTLAAGGDCLAKLGRDEEAIQYYTGALRFEPVNPTALMGMGELQFRRGATQEADGFMSRFSRVARATPDSVWLQLRIARKMNMIQDERGYAADLRRSFPDSPQTKLLEAGRYE